MTVTQDQLETMLRRVGSQLPPGTGLDAGRATRIRSRLAELAGAEARRPHFVVRLAGRSALVAAAAIALAVIWYVSPRPPRAATLAFDVAVGPSAGDLFRLQRSETSGGEWERVFVGVRAERDAFVRLLGQDQAGRIESLQLDRQGSWTLPLHAGPAVVYGGFAVENKDADRDSRLTHIIVLCSQDRISDDTLRDALSRTEAERKGGPLAAVQEWADRLAARLGPGTRARAVEIPARNVP
jgi:hypothetical protein